MARIEIGQLENYRVFYVMDAVGEGGCEIPDDKLRWIRCSLDSFFAVQDYLSWVLDEGSALGDRESPPLAE